MPIRFSRLLLFTLVMFVKITWSQETVTELCDRLAQRATIWIDKNHYAHADNVWKTIWIGNACAASRREWLRNHNISFVLNVAKERDQLFHPNSFERYKKIPLRDQWPTTEKDAIEMEETLEKAANEIHQWLTVARTSYDQGILVHCNLGISRSVSVVIRYLQRYQNYSYEKALAEIRSQRPVATPHPAFEQLLLGECTVTKVIEL